MFQSKLPFKDNEVLSYLIFPCFDLELNDIEYVYVLRLEMTLSGGQRDVKIQWPTNLKHLNCKLISVSVAPPCYRIST